MENLVESMETFLEPIELNDAELAAVAGGITLSFGSFGGAQNATATASGTNSVAKVTQVQ
jgi:hypothetical protein